MAWSAEFVDVLMSGSSAAFCWAIEVLTVGSVPSAGAYIIASAPGVGDVQCIGLRGVQVQGQRLSPASWSSTIGAFSVDIVGDPRPVFEHVTRGSWVRVLVGLGGWAIDRYQPIAIGRVYNISGAPPKWVIDCWDWQSALRSRNDPANPDLFYNVIGSTTTADAFAFTANSTTAFDVVATGAFERETSQPGALKVTTSGGDSFYLVYTAVPSSTRFTVSANDKFASTQVSFTSATPSVDAVDEVAFLAGHPMNIVRKLLTSTGAGTNGTYDVYPSGWGYAIPSYLVDNEDTDRQRDASVYVDSGSYTVGIHVDEPQTDGLAWLQSWMQPMGLFLTTRMGLITVRAYVCPSSTRTAIPGDPVAVITDDDIQPGSVAWEGWDSEYATEYYLIGFTSVKHNGTPITTYGTGAAPVTLPAANTLLIDVSASVYDNTDSVNVHNELIARLEKSRTRIPERIRLTVPLRFAQLAPGDGVFLDTTKVYGRQDDGNAYDGRYAVVVEVSPNWTGGECVVGLALFPTSEDAWV